MRLSPRQQMVVDHIPWVHLYKTSRPCTGWMSSGKRCKNKAYWRFTSLKRRGAWAMNVPNGVYCWSHLLSRGLYGSMDEEARTVDRLYEVGVLCQSRHPIEGHRCVRYVHDDNKHRTHEYTQPYSDHPGVIYCDFRWED